MMQLTATVDLSQDRTTLPDLAPRALQALTAAGAALCALGLFLGWFGPLGLRYFFHAYLANYCFFLSISLGALFFVVLQHATRAGWSVAVRRLAEIFAANVPVLALLSLPVGAAVLVGRETLYPWTDSSAAAGDELLTHKAPYLNVPFFLVRGGVYLLVWWLLARFYLRRSLEQDQSGDPALTVRMERFSGPALLLFAVSVTFAAFDWLMSLDPRWYSTIFGLYYFSGAIVGSTAVIILAAVFLQATGRLTASINVEHYHDLGKLLFGFVFFWGYIAFSQYLLIWYANVPEETTWYRDRQMGRWLWVSVALLLFGHLLIPFLGLLSREVKRRKPLLAFWAVWMLVFHWIDVYWLVMPNYWRERLGAQTTQPPGSTAWLLPPAIDLCLAAGLGCLYLAGALRVARGRPLIPLKDPRLAESLEFENF